MKNHNNLDSDPSSVPNREEAECLKVPALEKRAIATHPCDKDTKTTLKITILVIEKNPTTIKVI